MMLSSKVAFKMQLAKVLSKFYGKMENQAEPIPLSKMRILDLKYSVKMSFTLKHSLYSCHA